MARRACRRAGGAWGWSAASRGAKQPVVQLGVEDGNLDAVGGQHLAVGALDLADEVGESEAAHRWAVGEVPAVP